MKLQATLREVTGKQVNAYRKKNKIPAVLYGKHIEKPINLFFEKNEFLRVYKESGKSLPIQISGDGVDQLVLVHDIEIHPVTSMLSHVDFLAIKKGEKVSAEVEIRVVGTSVVESSKLGRVSQVLNTVNVVAIPTKLPKYIDVDVSTIQAVGDVIFVKDLSVATGVEIVADSELAVVTAVEFSTEVEEVVVSEESSEEE